METITLLYRFISHTELGKFSHIIIRELYNFKMLTIVEANKRVNIFYSFSVPDSGFSSVNENGWRRRKKKRFRAALAQLFRGHSRVHAYVRE